MKKNVFLLLTLAVTTGLLAGGAIGPELQKLLLTARDDQSIPVNIILREQSNNQRLEARCKGLNKAERWAKVVTELKRLAERSQRGLLSSLQALADEGAASGVEPLWIINGVHCHLSPAAVAAIAARPEVNYVEHSLIYTKLPYCITPETYDKMVKGNVTVPTDALEWNVRLVGADSVWSLLGYTGDSVIVGHIDTGINYNHVDFAGHLWSDTAYPHNGWNFEDGTGDNIDINGHGTHTAGTVCSNGTAGDTCGMAPKAQVMTCRVRTQADSTAEEQCFQAMQFCVAPPLSPEHHAQCITMSLGWELAWAPRQATWRQCVGNVSTAGLPYLIAAGNERGSFPPPNDLRCPGNAPGPWRHPIDTIQGGLGGCISIAATTSSDQIASFSSQGPVSWASVAPYNDYVYPPGLIHPDVGAPGENITSCAYNNNTGYLSGWNGTSMATPCVAGVVALMLEKNPELLPWQADSILQMTVKPLGSQPKNNDFGTGRISAYRAVVSTPYPGPLHDVTAEAILAPHDTLDTNATVTPRALVANLGNRTEDFPVILRIGSFYVDTTNIVLDPYARDTVDFTPLTDFPRGIVVMSCTTACNTDTYPPNNLATGSFVVTVSDIAADTLVKPANHQRIIPGLHLTPEVKVRNEGTQPLAQSSVAFHICARPDFTDTLWYRDTTIGALAPGVIKTVRFAQTYTPSDTGTFFMRLIVGNATNSNPLNDTLLGEFYIVLGIEEAEGGKVIRARVLPTIARAPFKPGPDLADVAFFDCLGRRQKDLLAPGVYYLICRAVPGRHKLLVLN
jgi:subtilisin family serine protease